MKSLNETLLYKNENVILKFIDSYNVAIEDAEDIFSETLKWLWLNAWVDNNKKENNLFINEHLIMIDKMWHVFILDSVPYEDFCNDYLNLFIHHEVLIPQESDLTLSLDDLKERYSLENKKMYEYIFDFLGQETLIKWVDSYGKKYYMNYIKSITNFQI